MAFLVFSPAVISGVVDCKTGIYYRGTYKDLFNFISTWQLSISDPMNPTMFLIFNFKRRMCFISKSVGSFWAQKALMPFVTLMEIKNKEKIVLFKKIRKNERRQLPPTFPSLRWHRKRENKKGDGHFSVHNVLCNVWISWLIYPPCTTIFGIISGKSCWTSASVALAVCRFGGVSFLLYRLWAFYYVWWLGFCWGGNIFLIWKTKVFLFYSIAVKCFLPSPLNQCFRLPLKWDKGVKKRASKMEWAEARKRVENNHFASDPSYTRFQWILGEVLYFARRLDFDFCFVFPFLYSSIIPPLPLRSSAIKYEKSIIDDNASYPGCLSLSVAGCCPQLVLCSVSFNHSCVP